MKPSRATQAVTAPSALRSRSPTGSGLPSAACSNAVAWCRARQGEGDRHAAAVVRHRLDLGRGDLGIKRQVVDLEPDPVALVGAQPGQQQPALGIGAAGLAVVEIDADVGEARQVDQPERAVDPARERHLAVDQGDAAVDAGAQGVAAVEALDREIAAAERRSGSPAAAWRLLSRVPASAASR